MQGTNALSVTGVQAAGGQPETMQLKVQVRIAASELTVPNVLDVSFLTDIHK